MNARVAIIVLLILAVPAIGAHSAEAQRSSRGRSAAVPEPLIGDMAPQAFAALGKISVHGIRTAMSIGEAHAILKERGYDFTLTPSMSRGSRFARFVALKGKRSNNVQDRERFDLHVLTDRPYDPRKRQPYNPDWPITKLDYVLDDRDNEANVKGFDGYDWTGTAERKITEQARDLVCGALVAESLACSDNATGFSAGPLQNGTLGGGRMYITEGLSGEYKIEITVQNPR